MPDSHDRRPLLIPPLARSTEPLEIVRDRPEPRHAEHPHCEEHFVFSPSCAACLEAERTRPATAHATPLPHAPHSPKPAARPSSRSFGFTDSFPTALANNCTFADELLHSAERAVDNAIASSIVDDLLDL